MPPDAPKILIAEDNPQQQFKTRELFELCGCCVVEALGGPEAFELALAETPDMILLDILLPDANGFAVLERLRRHPDLRHIPVLMLSSLSEPADVAKGLALGAAGYLSKPARPQALVSAIRGVLGMS